jgi:hypothetical protein
MSILLCSDLPVYLYGVFEVVLIPYTEDTTAVTVRVLRVVERYVVVLHVVVLWIRSQVTRVVGVGGEAVRTGDEIAWKGM